MIKNHARNSLLLLLADGQYRRYRRHAESASLLKKMPDVELRLWPCDFAAAPVKAASFACF
jgi:hypothetical protein